MQLFFSVGEPSGDLHGANLIRELRRLRPDLECVGYGGPKMAAAGCELHTDLTELAVMGLLPVLCNLGKFFALRDRAREYLRQARPDGVILIDYPGFNWHIARAAKEVGIPVFYYGAPQLWAWASWRVEKMRRLVDHVLCKLPFEETWFRQHQCRATYVGHPYYDQLATQKLDRDFLARIGDSDSPLVAILPGSRTQEVVYNLPAFLQTAATLQRDLPRVRFAIASYNDKQAGLARAQVAKSGLPIDVYVGHTQELIHAAHSCLACSGSVSLELLWHAKPTVIHYRAHPITYFLQGLFRRVKYITLVNLLADEDLFPKKIVPYDRDAPGAAAVPLPEYLTCRDRSADLAFHLREWLTDPAAYRDSVACLEQLRKRFAQPGASQAGAEYIMKNLSAAAPALRKAS